MTRHVNIVKQQLDGNFIVDMVVKITIRAHRDYDKDLVLC